MYVIIIVMLCKLVRRFNEVSDLLKIVEDVDPN